MAIIFFLIHLPILATVLLVGSGCLLFSGSAASPSGRSMAPLAEVGGFLGGLEGLGPQVGPHFLLPPAGERPPLLGERRGATERGARGGPGADRKSTRLNSSHRIASRMPSSA